MPVNPYECQKCHHIIPEGLVYYNGYWLCWSCVSTEKARDEYTCQDPPKQVIQNSE